MELSLEFLPVLNNFRGLRIDFDPVRDTLPAQHQN
jgi:hypothetical protein